MTSALSKKLTILTVSYNSKQVLMECLNELIHAQVCRFIIVDNASHDATAEMCRTRFPYAETISLPHNIGYGRAANIALKMVETPYALLINPDLHTTYESIEKLIQIAGGSSPECALWGPKTESSSAPSESIESVDWIHGCAMLFRMDAFDDIGFFDENIFLFYEETDLCFRIRKSGRKMQLCNDVLFDHFKGRSSAPNLNIERIKGWHMGWSSAYFYAKHGLAAKLNKSPKRVRTYYLKSLFALDANRRHRFRYRALGLKAQLAGAKAFDLEGLPYIP